MKMLELLYEERVLKVERLGDDTYMFMEACDFYFDVTLTKDEVRQLAKELLEMIGD